MAPPSASAACGTRRECVSPSPNTHSSTAFAVRLGFAYVRSLGPAARAACDDAIVAGANGGLAQFWHHTLLPRKAMENLVQVGAFDAVAEGKSRRQLLWQLKAIEEALPPRKHVKADKTTNATVASAGPPRGSGAIAGKRLGDAPHEPRDPGKDPLAPLVELPAPPPELPEMDERTRVTTEYAISQVSTGPHLVSFMRTQLDKLGCTPLRAVRDMADGARVRVAGLVITRQAPMSASGFRFFTLADEDTHLDLVFRPSVAQRTRDVARNPLLMVEGTLQVELGRINVVVATVTALDSDGHPLPSNAARVAAPPSHDFR
jgi:DNA polymerase III alpha subunit